MLRAREGVDALSETNHIHRSRCVRYRKGQIKGCHRYWQSKSNSKTKREFRHIDAVNDPYGRPKLVTAYEWRHPEWRIPSTAACEHTEAVFAKPRAKHGVERKR